MAPLLTPDKRTGGSTEHNPSDQQQEGSHAGPVLGTLSLAGCRLALLLVSGTTRGGWSNNGGLQSGTAVTCIHIMTRDIRSNIALYLRELPRAKLEGTPKGKVLSIFDRIS